MLIYSLYFVLDQSFYFTCMHIGQVVAKVANLYPKDMEIPAGGVDDMTKLSYLHEPGVLHNLAVRYEMNEIYVRLLSLSFANSIV